MEYTSAHTQHEDKAIQTSIGDVIGVIAPNISLHLSTIISGGTNSEKTNVGSGIGYAT